MADSQTQKTATADALTINAAPQTVQDLALLPEDGDDLEADSCDTDSAHHSDAGSGSTSLRSSIISGIVEHGRRFQSVRDNPMNFASDDKQFFSMEAGHMAYTILEAQQENPYFRAKLDPNAQHVLDIGTGQAGWAIGVADRFPNLTVHGVDLYPPPQTWVPPNCILEVDDVTKPWTWSNKFDLIHIRMFCGAIPAAEWTNLYKQTYENLAPGGWIEHVDVEMDMRCDDGSLPADSLLAKWREEMGSIAEKSGNTILVTDLMRQGIEDAGFVNVHEKKFKFPLGDWPRHPIYKEAGEMNKVHFKEGLEGWVMWLLTSIGWSHEEVTNFVGRMRKELDANYHIYQWNRRVWAQKPYAEETK